MQDNFAKSTILSIKFLKVFIKESYVAYENRNQIENKSIKYIDQVEKFKSKSIRIIS